MNRVSALLAAAAIGAIAAPSQAATIFNFQFDDQGIVPGDGPLKGAIVGKGTFASPIDLSPGLHRLSDLAGFTVNFRFVDGSAFGNADIVTPLTGVSVNITDFGAGIQRLFFTESGGTGSNGGPSGGAIDFVNGANTLSFEPSFYGGNFLAVHNGAYGRVRALSTPAVPEPATWAMMLAGFAVVGGAMRKSRQRPTARCNFA